MQEISKQTATIEVPIYFAPNGNPTCRTAEGSCLFYSVERWGTIERCSYTTEEIRRSCNDRRVDEMGYTEVTQGCLLHRDEE